MKILVVDDSKFIRMVVTECIVSMGHEIINVENGDEAIDYISENDVDLVLMDVEMPGRNGFDITLAIRTMKVDDWFPIIFLTTKVDDDSFARGILAGGDAYLPKPINPLRLQLTVTAMERIYMMRQKLQSAQKDLLQANKELERLALYDQLTGLANRRNFDETLERQFKLSARNKSALSLIICDIDFFKIYNDTYGHLAGDECIQQISQAIKKAIYRPTDLACRYGGEEFALILPETPLEGARHIAELIRQQVIELGVVHESSPASGSVTLSLGVATAYLEAGVESPEELINAADIALYLAKESGRNQVKTAEG